MGLQASSALTLLFSFLAYVIPLFGGWWADVHIGRYKAIMVGVLICGLAHIIQLVGAIPSVLQKGQSHAAPPFIIGLLLLAFGAGIFKPNIIPTVLDQNRHQLPYTKQLKSGEKVIVDPPITKTRTTLIFYGFVNVGAFYMLPCTYSEKYVGYWLSFLLTAVIYLMLPLLLLGMYTRTYKQPPSGTADFIQALSITKTALIQSRFRIWHKDFWDFARSPHLESKGLSTRWTDDAVSDVSRAMSKRLGSHPIILVSSSTIELY
jgi:dipeptide/tripeptide permease